MTATADQVAIEAVPDDVPRAPGSGRLAAGLWLAAAGPAALGVALLVSTPGGGQEGFGFPGFEALLALVFASVGAVIASRRPDNRIGAILGAVGVMAGLLMLAGQYARIGIVVHPGSLPGAIWAAWLGGWLWVPQTLLSGPLFLLVFPDGRLPSPRWRWVAVATIVAGLVSTAGLAFTIGPIEGFPGLDNPVGLLSPQATDVLALVFNLGLAAATLAAAASLVARFRASQREARLQVKWLAAAGFVLGIALPLGLTVGKVGEVAVILALSGIPLATGVAVLRYGLYEIDRIINRTLVYGLLTALLAGLYAASVGLMQQVSRAATGADSDAAIILTTLLVVTAFTPVRARLQTFVDHRFKEDRDPSVRLGAFTAELQKSVSRLDRDRVLRRLLEVILEAVDSLGGRIELLGPDRSAGIVAQAGSAVDRTVELSGVAGGSTLRLTLAPSRGRETLSVRDRRAIVATLAIVAEELAIDA